MLNGREGQLIYGVLRLNAKALGLALGLIGGLAVFTATNWLVIKGGDPLGPHLQLLNQYFVGYRVSFLGSLVGFLYGFAVGSLSGVLISWIYNKVAFLKSQK